jgi:hypothetical protein
MIDMLRKRWTRDTATPREATTPTAIEYVSEEAARLDRLRCDLVEARAALARAEVQRATSIARGDDAETDVQRATMGPKILALRQQVQRLTMDEGATEQAVVQTAELVAQYAHLAADTTAQFQPLFEAVARVTPKVVADMYTRSREMDRLAADLLRRTGDRRAFRRPVLDPYRALGEALDECQRLHARQRLLRSVGASATTKTGTE